MKAILMLLCWTTGRQDSLEALRILERAQDMIRNTKTLSYQAHFRQINNSLADSVFDISGTIWSERLPGDTIFGNRFHIKDEDVDYYYDSTYCLEVRHADRKIVRFDPWKDGSRHTPAKARIALVPMLALETDTALASTLLRHCVSLHLAKHGEEWVLTFYYGETTREIFIGQQNYRVHRVHEVTHFNGVTFDMMHEVTALRTNQADIPDSIPLTKSYDYAVETETRHPVVFDTSLVGTPAKDFSYPSTEGRTWSLSASRGKYVLLDFWETWCGWCIEAFPHLRAMDTLYRNLQILGVVTENKAQVKKLAEDNHFPYPTLLGDPDVLKNYGVQARPTYVLIDPQGKIIAYAPGDLDKINAVLKAASAP